DVYVAGYESNNSFITVAKLWKNGTAKALSDGSQNARAYSVYVSGNDVYVAGFDDGKAVLWKNNDAAIALTDGSHTAYAYSVFVSGNNVYVVGNEYDAGRDVAKLWKDKVEQTLADADNTLARSVYVSGNDVVYVAGYKYDAATTTSTPVLWRNGIAQTLDYDATQNVFATSVFVSDGNIYVAGYKSDMATGRFTPILWTNGTEQTLPYDTQYNSIRATSVFVFDGDVYVAGDLSLWKNGEVQPLSGQAQSVFVVKRP
ncbi:MAG: hypothetical protein LBT27_04615, partial [Prevotellaceae bacterium]|nr:hypothetical protein [Prevotellaceae bacterium]